MTKDIIDSEDSSSLSSCPSNKSIINDNSSLSEGEGAQTCLFESYDSKLTKLRY